MRFEDCIGLVHLRGRLFDEVAPGGMLSVALPLDEARALIGEDLDIAGVNAPGLTAVSGPNAALQALEARLRAQEVEFQRIPIDIAAHSRMLEPILKRFGDHLRSIPLSAPQIPLISNRSGTYLTPDQATDPDYWVGHLRNTVHLPTASARWPKDRPACFSRSARARRSPRSRRRMGRCRATRSSAPCATPRKLSPTTPISWVSWGGSGPPA
jgi:acyl transferase domain-containing protein